MKSRSQTIQHLMLTLLVMCPLLLAGVGFRSPDKNGKNDKNDKNDKNEKSERTPVSSHRT